MMKILSYVVGIGILFLIWILMLAISFLVSRVLENDQINSIDHSGHDE